jgi:hypothetical protein
MKHFLKELKERYIREVINNDWHFTEYN